MPLCQRKPNLAALVVPPSTYNIGSEEVKTPLPHTPMVYESINAPLIMTPDTPCFDMPSIDSITQGFPFGKSVAEAPWSDDEDNLILSYLSHPPRPLRTSYPPGSLPPPQAIDELTAMIMTTPQWSRSRSFSVTRARIFELARKSIADVLGGQRKREKTVVQSMYTTANRVEQLQRPKLCVLGSAGMNRQQHSMDSLYGDSEPVLMTEALRLSSTLQDSASRGTVEPLGSTDSLSSPLAFTFTFNPPSLVQPIAGPTGVRKPVQRPSLLQRGKSFTSYDISAPMDSAMSSDDDSETISPKGSSMLRSASSPMTYVSSPPSSTSSRDTEMDLAPATDLNTVRGWGTLELDTEPFTPLNQTFPASISLHHAAPLGSNETTPGPKGISGTTTPAITLTVDSPPKSKATTSPTASPTHTAKMLADLSLTSSQRAPPPPPSARRRTVGAATLTRSLSEGVMSRNLDSVAQAASLPQSISFNSKFAMSNLPTLPPVPTSSSSSSGTLSRPMVKRQRSNAPGLSVFVPRPAGRTWSDELRSPFEHKPAGAGEPEPL